MQKVGDERALTNAVDINREAMIACNSEYLQWTREIMWIKTRRGNGSDMYGLSGYIF